jgi:hypothetical protein
MDMQIAIINWRHHKVHVLKAIRTLRKARKAFSCEDQNLQTIEESCLNDIKFHMRERRKWLRYLIKHKTEWREAA